MRQHGGVDVAQPWQFPFPAAGGDERRLGHAVAGVEGLGTEPAGGEVLGEPLQCLAADRLGAVEGQVPTAEIELIALLGLDLAHAQVVSEVRAAARCASVLRDGLQPP